VRPAHERFPEDPAERPMDRPRSSGSALHGMISRHDHRLRLDATVPRRAGPARPPPAAQPDSSVGLFLATSFSVAVIPAPSLPAPGPARQAGNTPLDPQSGRTPQRRSGWPSSLPVPLFLGGRGRPDWGYARRKAAEQTGIATHVRTTDGIHSRRGITRCGQRLGQLRRLCGSCRCGR
jgi:hypothetical protein